MSARGKTRRVTRFLSHPVVFGSIATFFFVWTASESLAWALAASFMILVILSAIADAVDRILEAFRDAGLLPTLEDHRSHAPERQSAKRDPGRPSS